MVALNKTYRKTLTPDRSAKDSGFRYYSPEISRWLNRDPIGEEVRLNLYAFTMNRPVNACDARGLEDHQYHVFSPAGIMHVWVKNFNLLNHWQGGINRKIIVQFLLRPCYERCSTLGLLQEFATVSNVEGNETETTSGDPLGTWYPDVSLGGGVLPIDPNGIQRSDWPGNAADCHFRASFKLPSGEIVFRKVNTVFRTCAVCFEGADANKTYGCVRWGLIYTAQVLPFPEDLCPRIVIGTFHEEELVTADQQM